MIFGFGFDFCVWLAREIGFGFEFWAIAGA
jgi:hypothetical protein